MSLSSIYGSTPPVRHPPVCPPLISTLAFSACMLIPMVLRSRLQVVTKWNGCWLDVIAATVRFLRCVCPTPAPMPPPQSPARAYATPSTVDSFTTMDSLYCSQDSVPSALLGPPSVIPRLLYPSRPSCCSHQVPCVFGALDPVSNDEVPIPCLHVQPLWQPPAHAATALLAVSDDEVPILYIPPCSGSV
jgi:hypothetical protein